MAKVMRKIACLFVFLATIMILSQLIGPTARAEKDKSYSIQTISCIDEDYIQNVVCANGILYALYDSGLYQIPYGKDEKNLIVPSAKLPEDIQSLMSDNGEVYCFANKTDLLHLIDRQGRIVQETIFTTDEEVTAWGNEIKLHDDKLYYISEDRETRESEICILSHDGQIQSIPVEGLNCFDVMPDGSILAYTRVSHWPDTILTLQMIELQSEKVTLWAEIETDGNLYGLLYDDCSLTAYLFSRNDIYAVQENKEMTRVGSFPAGDIVSTCLVPEGIAIVSDDFLAIRPTYEYEGENTVITIMEQYGRAEFYKAFFEKWPGVEVRFVDSGSKTPEEIYLDDMLIGNDNIDIYLLSDTNILRSIRKKGFYSDLSVSEEIKDKVSRMYAPFKEAFTYEGKIYAYPHDTFIEALAYHKESFKYLGVEPPKTYKEFFEFCLDYLDSQEDQLLNVYVDPFINGMDLVYLLTRYTDELIREGKPIQYQTTELDNVLRDYLTLKNLVTEAERGSNGYVPLFYSYDLGVLDENAEYDYLPLTFDSESQPLYAPLEGDFSFYVINPRSKHVQEATELILSYQNMGAFPTDSTVSAIENPQYEQELETMHQMLEGLEYDLSQQEDEEKQNILIKMIEEQRKDIDTYEIEGRWLISQNQLDRCGQLAAEVYISDFNPVYSAYAEEPEMFDNLKIDGITSFLNKLDNRINMIFGENE